MGDGVSMEKIRNLSLKKAILRTSEGNHRFLKYASPFCSFYSDSVSVPLPQNFHCGHSLPDNTRPDPRTSTRPPPVSARQSQ